MQPVIFKPILAIVFLVTFISCKKEINSKLNVTTDASAQGDDPSPTQPTIYPLEFQGLINLSVARGDLASASCANKIFFAGGRTPLGGGNSTFYSTVDIFNADDLSRTTAQLSQARYWLSAGTLGSKVFFAGGMNASGHSNRVDIYDTQNNTWSVAYLSQARYMVAITSTKTQIFFAGGITYGSGRSNRVDIYDAPTNSWSTTTIKTVEGQLAGATTGTTTLFAGHDYDGMYPGTQYVKFNTYPVLQTFASLPGHSSQHLSAISINGKIMFAGGYDYPLSKKVSIYDVASKTWSSHNLSQARMGIATCRIDKFAVFAGGSLTDDGAANRMDIYNSSTGNWSSFKMTHAWWPLSAASAGKVMLIASNAQVSPAGLVMVYKLTNPPPTTGPGIP